MGMTEAVKLFFSRYTDFKGRSSRGEYWWAYLGLVLLIIVPYFLVVLFTSMGIQAIAGLIGILLLIFYLAIIIPGIAIVIRRLHDLDKSGWWYFIALVPLIGGLLLLYWFCQPGTKGPNTYGGDPLGGMDVNAFD